MLETFSFAVAVGTILGFLAGLGVGGGSLLILWLTLVVQQPHQAAQAINLLFFVPTAVITSLFRIRQGSLNIRKILPALIAGTAGAALFTFLGMGIETELLRKPFGILLLATGLKELFYRPRKAR